MEWLCCCCGDNDDRGPGSTNSHAFQRIRNDSDEDDSDDHIVSAMNRESVQRLQKSGRVIELQQLLEKQLSINEQLQKKNQVLTEKDPQINSTLRN